MRLGNDRNRSPVLQLPLGGGASPAARAGITLAAAGDMDLAKRDRLPWRGRLLEAIGVSARNLRCVRQVHSRIVVRVGRDDDQLDGTFPQADGMVTDCAELLLAITVADCLPIFIADRRTGAFAIVHSGWKGTGIVLEAIALMRSSFASRPRDLAVTMGPGIGACCYRVPPERAATFGSSYGEASVRRGLDGAMRIDLRQANLGLLAGQGVEDIFVVEDCTCCDARLGSLRREGPGSFTRMLAFIGAWTLP